MSFCSAINLSYMTPSLTHILKLPTQNIQKCFATVSNSQGTKPSKIFKILNRNQKAILINILES